VQRVGMSLMTMASRRRLGSTGERRTSGFWRELLLSPSRATAVLSNAVPPEAWPLIP
jgi:hypothetical protein